MKKCVYHATGKRGYSLLGKGPLEGQFGREKARSQASDHRSIQMVIAAYILDADQGVQSCKE